MSTEYYLACDQHRELVWACSDGLSGPLLQCDRTFAAFVVTHMKCALNVVSEHEVDAPPFDDYRQCHDETWEAILDYDKAEEAEG